MKFSIITPTYNSEKTIKRALESVINQTYENYEMIIIDDGSTDETENIVKQYLSEKIKYIKLDTNMGVNKARNFGLNNISKYSDFVTFLDSDDTFFKDALETMLINISKYPDYKIYSFSVVDEKGNSCSFLQSDILEVGYSDMISSESVKGEWVHCVSSNLVRNKEFYYEEKVKNGSESLIYLRLSKKYLFLHISKVVRKYFTDNESLTRFKVMTYAKAENAINGLNIFFEENKEYVMKNRKKYSFLLSVLAHAYYYYGNKRKVFQYTIEAFKYNPLEPRIYRNILLLLGVKL